MNALDYTIIGVSFVLAVLGFAQGFIIGAASLVGLALGGIVGTRAAQAVLGDGGQSPYAPLIGLGIGMGITMIGSFAMQDIGASLRRQVRGSGGRALDRMLGGVLLAIVGLLLSWFAATASVGVPQLRGARPLVLESRIVSTLNGLMPPSGPVLNLLASYDPFPKFNGPQFSVRPPDARLPADPQVRRASRSVVRVVGTACGFRVTGSGWVIADGFVVTNAHVVAGQEDTGVEVGGSGDALGADLVAFDDVNDLAMLRVPDLELPALRTNTAPAPGTAGVVLGYPESGPFDARPARFGDTRSVSSRSLAGDRKVRRKVTSFRGLVRHGNSGGPVVDGDGSVLTTVFAATVGDAVAGGYGIPNSTLAGALAAARSIPLDKRLDSGRCIG